MTDEMKSGTPLLAGWAIAGAAGLVAFGVSMVVVGLGLTQAAFVAALIFAVVGVILGLAHGDVGGPVAASPVASASVAAAPAPAAAAPAPVVAAPVAAAPVAATPAPVSAAPAAAPAAPVAARRPAALTAARAGGPDDLKRIKGVGPKLEALLHSLGFYHFDQVAAWTDEELAWVDDHLEGFKGRASRDNWVAQAKTLAAGGAV